MTTTTTLQCDPHCLICGGTGTAFGKRCVCVDRAMAFADQLAMTQCPVGPSVGNAASPSPVCMACRRVPCRCHTTTEQTLFATTAAETAQPTGWTEIPEGFALVPIEPTEDMVVHGFESRPDPIFQPEHWDKYEEMTGCQQAAFRARLCWAAMIAAAPVAQEGEQEALRKKLEGKTETCWSCKVPYTERDRAESDGHCPHCGVEIELDDENTQPTPSDSGSVDTPAFRMLEAAFVQATIDLSSKDHHADNAELFAARKAFVAHIDSLIAARVAGVRKDAERLDFIEQGHLVLDPCENEDGSRCYEVNEILGDKEDDSKRTLGFGLTARAAINAAMAAHSPATGNKES